MEDEKMAIAARKRNEWETQLLAEHQGKKSMGESAWTSPVIRAILKPTQPKVLIKANCWNCVGGDDDAGGRTRVRDCTVFRCAFWPARPWQDVSGKSTYLDHPDNARANEADSAGDAQKIVEPVRGTTEAAQ